MSLVTYHIAWSLCGSWAS